jgi:FKBP-type peptidyl-prolyl cis-trans isomerase
MLKIWIFLVCFLFLSFACKENNRELSGKSPQEQKDALMRINKYLVKKDAEAIKGFISRRGWSMVETKSGLWFEKFEEGKGAKAETGKMATLAYKLWLLDGTLCYSSDSLGAKSFLIGKGGVEPGLETGILMLREGDKARLILPPHLGFGLMGDENRIPARATIVYEIKVLKISD